MLKQPVKVLSHINLRQYSHENRSIDPMFFNMGRDIPHVSSKVEIGLW